VIRETNATTGNITDYLYGDDLIKQTKAANDSYYLYDGLGSTRALTDDIGLISDTYDYSSFGITLNQTGSTENNYLFTGEQYDSNLDNYYLRARYYNQVIGRFTQMDSWERCLGEPLGLNKYIYADSDPVNNIDPTGNITLQHITTTVAVSGILIGASQFNYNSMSMSGSNNNDGYTYTIGFPDPLTSPPPDPGRFCEAQWIKRVKKCKGSSAGVRTCIIKAYIRYLGCKSLDNIERVLREINNNDLDGF
jgi:RHS repeat-associated protein